MGARGGRPCHETVSRRYLAFGSALARRKRNRIQGKPGNSLGKTLKRTDLRTPLLAECNRLCQRLLANFGRGAARFRMRTVIEMIAGLALAIPRIQISHDAFPKVAAAANRPIMSNP